MKIVVTRLVKQRNEEEKKPCDIYVKDEISFYFKLKKMN
jgi:hypothetical protein